MLIKKLTPRIVISGLTFVWSLVTIFTGFIESPGSLYAVRLLLGACEAGLFPALTLYLANIYRRDELAKRVSYLFVATALAGAFGGILCYGILFMDGIGGKAGWRWVYIIEGVGSFVLAVIVWFSLPNEVEYAYFLNPRERDLVRWRADQTRDYSGNESFSWTEIRIAALDIKTYISAAIQFCQDILLYGFSTFLPSIIEAMGHTGIQTQYLTIPVYIVGGIFFVAFAYLSDRTQIRVPVRIPCELIKNNYPDSSYHS